MWGGLKAAKGQAKDVMKAGEKAYSKARKPVLTPSGRQSVKGGKPVFKSTRMEALGKAREAVFSGLAGSPQLQKTLMAGAGAAGVGAVGAGALAGRMLAPRTVVRRD